LDLKVDTLNDLDGRPAMPLMLQPFLESPPTTDSTRRSQRAPHRQAPHHKASQGLARHRRHRRHHRHRRHRRHRRRREASQGIARHRTHRWHRRHRRHRRRRKASQGIARHRTHRRHRTRRRHHRLCRHRGLSRHRSTTYTPRTLHHTHRITANTTPHHSHTTLKRQPFNPNASSYLRTGMRNSNLKSTLEVPQRNLKLDLKVDTLRAH